MNEYAKTKMVEDMEHGVPGKYVFRHFTAVRTCAMDNRKSLQDFILRLPLYMHFAAYLAAKLAKRYEEAGS